MENQNTQATRQGKELDPQPAGSVQVVGSKGFEQLEGDKAHGTLSGTPPGHGVPGSGGRQP